MFTRKTILFVLLACVTPQNGFATVIYESALFNAGARSTFGVGDQPFFNSEIARGARFSVDATVDVVAIGGAFRVSPGDLEPNTPNEIFAVIIELGPAALPSVPLGDLNVLASTVFDIRTLNTTDILVPLQVTLGPGDYARVEFLRSLRR